MKCKYCKFFETNNKGNFKQHEDNCWNNPNSLNKFKTYFYCEHCKKQFQRHTELDLHNTKVHNTKKQQHCNYCNKNWETTDNYYFRHIEKCFQNRGNIKCSYCNKRDNDENIIKKHEDECSYNPNLIIEDFDAEKYKVRNKNTKNIGVYKIVTPSNKVYIGMTNKSFEERWGGHLKELIKVKHKCLGLINAFNKYGWDNLNKEIIDEYIIPEDKIESINLYKHILKREKELWSKYNNNNIMLNGEPTGTGSVRHTDETREKQRKASLAKKETICYVFFVNCKNCTKLFCGRGSNAQYCYKCIPDGVEREFKNINRKIEFSRICNNDRCCNFIVKSKGKYCSKECDDRVIKDKCEYCGTKVKAELINKDSKRYCNSSCQSKDRYEAKRALFPKVIELHETGLTYGNIAKQFPTLSRQTIYNYIKKDNFSEK